MDLQSGAAIDGDTGVAVAGTDDFRIFEANINGLKWLKVEIKWYIMVSSGKKWGTRIFYTNTHE